MHAFKRVRLEVSPNPNLLLYTLSTSAGKTTAMQQHLPYNVGLSKHSFEVVSADVSDLPEFHLCRCLVAWSYSLG